MKAKSIKSLVSIVLVTLMLMPVFVGAASAEESSGSRYYIDLGEMDLRGEGYYLSFALPAGYEVTDKAVKYVEYVDDIKGEVCAVYPGYAEIRIVGSSDAINHIYSSSVYVYYYHHACCDETGLNVTIDYDEAIEENCGDLARYHGPIKYTRIHGHDACYWENPGEDRYDMMHAHIFLEESHIYWVSSSTVGRQVGNGLFSSIQISGLPPTEEEPIEPPSTPIEVGTTPPETPTVISEEQRYMEKIGEAVKSEDIRTLIDSWTFAMSDRCSEDCRDRMLGLIAQNAIKIDKSSSFWDTDTFKQFVDDYALSHTVFSDYDDYDRQIWLNSPPYLRMKALERYNEFFNKKNDPHDGLDAVSMLVHESLQYSPEDCDWVTTEMIAVREEGDCTDYANLFIDLARSIGFPARKVNVFGKNTLTEKKWGHAVPEVYVNGEWVTFDPTSLSGSIKFLRVLDEKLPEKLFGGVTEAYYYDGSGRRHDITSIYGGG